MKILENLTKYEDSHLKEIKVNGIFYKSGIDDYLKVSGIVALSFGESRKKSSYNYRLARAIKNVGRVCNFNLPAIVQSEIGECYNKFVGKSRNLHIVGENYGVDEKSIFVSQINSMDVLNLASEIIKKEKIDKKRLIYLAHPAHMARVIAIGKKFDLKGVPFIEKNVAWPKNDGQLFVRFPFLWSSREILVRALYNCKGFT